MFWTFKVSSLFMFYILNPVVFSKEKTLQRGTFKRLQYAIFKTDLFHSLDGKAIEVGYVETEKHCLLKCVKNLHCFSANIGVRSGNNGQVLCELLSSDKYNSSKSFRANASFHHYRISVSKEYIFLGVCVFPIQIEISCIFGRNRSFQRVLL